jgi:hypothetical protein
LHLDNTLLGGGGIFCLPPPPPPRMRSGRSVWAKAGEWKRREIGRVIESDSIVTGGGTFFSPFDGSQVVPVRPSCRSTFERVKLQAEKRLIFMIWASFWGEEKSVAGALLRMVGIDFDINVGRVAWEWNFYNIVSDTSGPNFDDTFRRVACEARSATWNLVTNYALALELKKITENLDQAVHS